MSKSDANILSCHPKFLWSFQRIMRGHLNFCRFSKNDSVPLLNRQFLLMDLFAKKLNLPGGYPQFSLFIFSFFSHRGLRGRHWRHAVASPSHVALSPSLLDQLPGGQEDPVPCPSSHSPLCSPAPSLFSPPQLPVFRIEIDL